MGDDPKKRVGRPPSKGKSGPGEYVGFRAPRELKAQLEEAAHAAGRSLSSETQFRLERSFLDVGLIEQILDMLYGPKLAGLLMVIGRVADQAGEQSAALISPTADMTSEWFDDPYPYQQAEKAISEVLRFFRPSGDASAPKIRELAWAAAAGQQFDYLEDAVKDFNTLGEWYAHRAISALISAKEGRGSEHWVKAPLEKLTDQVIERVLDAYRSEFPIKPAGAKPVEKKR
jgi:hypothetical protein